MNNHELIQEIARNAAELEAYATGGGNAEYAFDLWANSKELREVHSALEQLHRAVEIEAGNRAAHVA